jgi:hypothetical protein
MKNLPEDEEDPSLCSGGQKKNGTLCKYGRENLVDFIISNN